MAGQMQIFGLGWRGVKEAKCGRLGGYGFKKNKKLFLVDIFGDWRQRGYRDFYRDFYGGQGFL